MMINTIFVFTFWKSGILSSFIEIFICYCTKISLAALVKKARLFFVVSSECTRGNGHIKKYKSFYQNIRKNFLTIRVIEHWKRLPRGAVQPPSLEMHILKTQLDTDLSNLLKLTLLWRERSKTRQSPKVPSNLSCSVMLWKSWILHITRDKNNTYYVYFILQPVWVRFLYFIITWQAASNELLSQRKKTDTYNLLSEFPLISLLQQHLLH